MILLYMALAAGPSKCWAAASQRRGPGRAQTRTAKSCVVRGIFKVKNHFPALSGCFNLSATWY
jgi:hypothetical protein